MHKENLVMEPGEEKKIIANNCSIYIKLLFIFHFIHNFYWEHGKRTLKFIANEMSDLVCHQWLRELSTHQADHNLRRKTKSSHNSMSFH